MEYPGWTFQEMLLSTRMLFFTTSGMHFKCGHEVRSEYDYTLEQRYVPQAGKFGIKDEFQLGSLRKMQDRGDIYWQWIYWIVMGYGDRKVTNPTDVFPSLSGIAQVFGTLLRDNHVAGLWAKRLASDLLWVCYPPFLHTHLKSVLS